MHQYEHTGTAVGHKCSEVAISVKKALPNKKEGWIIAENVHEAIVTHGESQKVQEILKLGRKRDNHGIQEYPLRGVARCAECHRIVTHRTGRKGTVYYPCDKSVPDPGASYPRGKHFMETDIGQVMFHAIQQMLTLCRQKENQKTALWFIRVGRINACMAELTRLRQLQERYRQEELTLYEGYITGDCSKEHYPKRKTEVDKTVQRLGEDIKKQESALAVLEEEAHTPESPLLRLSKQYRDTPSLAKEMVRGFIQDIYICPDSQTEIVWEFRDCFTDLTGNQVKETEDNYGVDTQR